MAKRQPKQTHEEEQLLKYRPLVLKLTWGVVLIISVLFGYFNGYPVAAQGQIGKGILIGLAYGGGALLVILISVFLNRKLKGS